MPITPYDPFFWRHYEGEIILLCVRGYLSFPLSYRHMATIMAERGFSIHASCIWRWVQIYGPELEKRCRPHPLEDEKSITYPSGTIVTKMRDAMDRVTFLVVPLGRRGLLVKSRAARA